MGEVKDPALLQRLNSGASATPTSGPIVRKPVAPPVSPNYAPEGTAGVTYVPGSAADPAVIARNASIEAAVRAGVDIGKARQMSDIELQEAIAKKALDKPQRAFDNETTLRKEYDSRPIVKAYTSLVPTFADVVNSKATPINDQALLYAAAKVWDPDSVVREGEQAMIQNAQAYTEQLKAEFGLKTGTGSMFTDKQRTAIRMALFDRMRVINSAYNAERQRYRDIAQGSGLRADMIIPKHAGTPYVDRVNSFVKSVGGTPYDAGAIANEAPVATGIATGEAKKIPDPALKGVNATVDAMLRRGDSDEAILGYIESKGLTNTTTQQTLDWRRAHPGYKGSYRPDLEFKFEGVPVSQQIFNKAIQSAPGAAVASGLDVATMGIPSAAMGREGLDILQQQSPVASGVGQIAGGLLGGYGAGRLATSLLPNLPRAAPIAGELTYSTITGAGTARPGERGGGALMGLGAGIGGEVVGRGVLAPAIKAGSNAFGRTATGQAMRAKMGLPDLLPAPNRGDVTIGQNLGASPEEVAASLRQAQQLAQQQGFTSPMMLSDVTPNLQTLAGSAARRSPDVRGMAQQQLEPRSLGQIERFRSGIETQLGPTTNVTNASEELMAQARTAAAPLYEKAYAREGASNAFERVKNYLKRPSMRSAMTRAARIAQEEGRDPTALGFDLDKTGEIVLTRVPSWQTLDYVKRGLDDVLEQFRDPTTQKLILDESGRAINKTQREFLAVVDKINPDYAAARKVWAGPVREKEALQFGRESIGMKPADIEVRLGTMAPGEQTQAGLGYRTGLVEQAEKVRYTGDPYAATLGSPQQVQRLGSFYPQQGGAQSPLLQQMGLERQMGATAREVLGGSPTAARMRADEAFDYSPGMQFATDVGADVVGGQGLLASAVRRGVTAGGDIARVGFGTRKAEAVAPQLFDPSINPDEWLIRQRGVQDYIAQQEAMRRAAGRVGGVAGVGLFAPGYGN